MPMPLPHQRHPDSTQANPFTWGDYWEAEGITPDENYWVPSGATSGPRTPLYSNNAAGAANIDEEIRRKAPYYQVQWVNPETGQTQWAPVGQTPPVPGQQSNLLLYAVLAVGAYLILK